MWCDDICVADCSTAGSLVLSTEQQVTPLRQLGSESSKWGNPKITFSQCDVSFIYFTFLHVCWIWHERRFKWLEQHSWIVPVITKPLHYLLHNLLLMIIWAEYFLLVSIGLSWAARRHRIHWTKGTYTQRMWYLQSMCLHDCSQFTFLMCECVCGKDPLSFCFNTHFKFPNDNLHAVVNTVSVRGTLFVCIGIHSQRLQRQ